VPAPPETQANAPASRPRRIVAPAWASRLYDWGRGRFALKPSRAAGIYILLPEPGPWASFVLTAWFLVLFLFASLDTSPFIYFRF